MRSTLCSQGQSYRILSFIYIRVDDGDDDAVSRTVFYFDFESKPGFIICLVFETFPLCFHFKRHGQIYCFIILFYFVVIVFIRQIQQVPDYQKDVDKLQQAWGEKVSFHEAE